MSAQFQRRVVVLCLVLRTLGMAATAQQVYGDPGAQSSSSNGVLGGPGDASTKKMSHVRCPLRQSEVFVRDATGHMVVYNPSPSPQQQQQQRRKLADDEEEALPSSSLRGSHHADTDGPDDQHQDELFHPCWCTEYYGRPMEYCPASLRVCVVHGVNGPVQCRSHSGTASLAQVVWPSGFFYVIIAAAVFLLTSKGRYTAQYIRRKWCRPPNMTQDEMLRQWATQLLQQARENGQPPALLGPDFVRREQRILQQQQQQRQAQQQQEQATPKPKRKKVKKPYMLRTKSFSATSSSAFSSSCSSSSSSDDNSQYDRHNDDNDDDDDDDEPECAICLGLLQEGEKVGDIPCGHLFHKDCLKTWVKRHKRCPLCQDQRLLTRHDDGDGDNDNHKQVETSNASASSSMSREERSPTSSTSSGGGGGSTSTVTGILTSNVEEEEVGIAEQRRANVDVEQPSNAVLLYDDE